MAENPKTPPNPFANPAPKVIFTMSNEAQSAHRTLIMSQAFQDALVPAQMHYVRAMCAMAPQSLDTENYLQAAAMCFARIQGMNDFVSLFCGFAEVPVQPAKSAQDPRNLEGN